MKNTVFLVTIFFFFSPRKANSGCVKHSAPILNFQNDSDDGLRGDGGAEKRCPVLFCSRIYLDDWWVWAFSLISQILPRSSRQYPTTNGYNSPLLRLCLLASPLAPFQSVFHPTVIFFVKCESHPVTLLSTKNSPMAFQHAEKVSNHLTKPGPGCFSDIIG